MADVLANMISENLTEENKKELIDYFKNIKIKIENFYKKADTTLQLNLNLWGSSIFEQMKNTQISSKELANISDIIKDARKDLDGRNKKDKEKISKLTELAQEGYLILASAGEIFRGRSISYVIYDYDGNILKQKHYNLEDFVKHFSMQKKGDISFTNLGSYKNADESILSEYYRNGLPFQNLIRSEYIYELFEQYEQGNLNQKQIDSINKQLGEGKTLEEIFDIFGRAYHSRGRLVEWAAKVYNRGDYVYNEQDYNEILQDFKEFYKGPDFSLYIEELKKTIDIQAKLKNAGQKLSTIMNGMAELTQIFYNYIENSNNILKNKILQDADGAEEEIYKKLLEDLQGFFK